MPYGFIEYIENKGYSTETVRSYLKVVNQFFTYIKLVYPENKEPFQISSADIKNYLSAQKERNKSISTINKELAIIKTMFHYFWENNRVPIDPAVKIKRFKTDSKPVLDIEYEEVQSLTKKVINNPDYSSLRKAIFLLASKGLRTSEYRFHKDNVINSDNKDKVEIILNTRTIILENIEAACFLEYFYEALFNEGDYVFTTKPRNMNEREPIQVMSILNHLRAISHDYYVKPPLTLISIRKSLVYYLYNQKKPIQQIAKDLGIEESSASNYIKGLMENIELNKDKEITLE